MKLIGRHGVLALLGLLAVGAGCSGGGGGNGARSSSALAPSTSATTASPTSGNGAQTPIARPTSATPATPATPSSLLGPPKLTVTSPVRGSFTTQMAAKVEGVVTAPAGCSALFIQGQAVPVPGANGAFSEVIPLTPGMNTITVEVHDGNRKVAKETLSIVAGNFSPDTQPIANAIAARLNKGAFVQAGKLAETIVTPAVLSQQITSKVPLFQDNLKVLFVSIPTTVTAPSASFGQPSITLTPQAGSIHLHVEVPNVNIGTKVHAATLIPLNLSGTMTASKMILDTDIAISLANGVLSTQLVNATDDFQNFKIDMKNIPNFIDSLLNGTVKKLVVKNVADQVHSTVQPMVDDMLGKFAKPVTQTVLGLQMSVSIQPTVATVDPTGLSLLTGSNVNILPVNGYQPLPAPGSLVTNGTPPTFANGTADFAVSANEDFVNRVMFEAWHAGAMDLKVDAQSPLLSKLPSFLTAALDTDLLTLFMPQLAGKVKSGHPIAFVLSPKLPAVFKAGAAPNPIDFAMGELDLSIYDTATTPSTLILTLALQTHVQANAAIMPGNKVKLGIGPNMLFDLSLASSPLVPDLDLTSVTNLVNVVVPPLVQLGQNFLPPLQLPIPDALGPKTADMLADGVQKTFLTIRGSF